MSRKEPIEDMPLRIYKSTIDRVNQYLDQSKFKIVKLRGKKKVIKKTSLNEFLVLCLDAYEMVKENEVLYANELFKDLAEARGDAVMRASRAKEQVKLPIKVVVIGKDEL